MVDRRPGVFTVGSRAMPVSDRTSDAPPRPRYLRPALLGLAAWTLVGLLLTLLLSTVDSRARGRSFLDLLVFIVPVWWLWWPLSPAAFYLGRRFPLIGRRWYRRLPLHLAAGLAAALVIGIGASAWFLVAYPYPKEVAAGTTFGEVYELYLVTAEFPSNLFVYWMLVIGSSALTHYRRSRQRAMRAVQLEAELGRARLRALKMQLQPHFLFNTLNTVVALVLKQETGRAVAMLNHLAAFLRLTLEEEGAQEVPLRRELAFAEKYVAIERVRFPDRLEVQVVAPPEVLDAPVPNLLLQPLVENWVRHAIGPGEGGGQLQIRAARHRDRLRLEVADHGPGLGSGAPWGGLGIGLRNTEERLRQLYGEAHALVLENRSSGGLKVIVELPWRSGEAAALEATPAAAAAFDAAQSTAAR